MAARPLLHLLLVHSSRKVCLVSYEDHLRPLCLAQAHWVPLVNYIIKRALIGFVEDHEYSVAPFEVSLDNRSIPLLPGSIPDVELDELVVVSDVLHLEVDGGDSLLSEAEELSLGVLPEERGLSNRRVADNDKLEALLLPQQEYPLFHVNII